MIIGIDLGTTNSLAGFWQEDHALLIPNALGQLLTPSVVSVDEDEHILIGEAAKERLVTHPDRTVAAFKRYMGSDRITRLGKHAFRPEELSALVLKSLKADAEAYLHAPVTEAVITVPAYFNDAQRKATRIAGELAGLKVERLLNEPTAAALAYGLHEARPESRFAVLDLGGGTFDVSVLEFFEGVMEVRASAGDNFLGGEDFADLLARNFLENTAPEAWRDAPPAVLMGRIKKAAIQLLHQLSDTPNAQIQVVWNNETVVWSFDNTKFDPLAQPLLERLRAPIERAIRDSRFKLRDLDELILVGGATRIAIVRQAITRLFGRFPSARIHPDQAIALGAVTQAALKARNAALEDLVLTDICPYSLGVSTSREISHGTFEHDIFSPIIERNTLIPCSREKSFSPLRDNQTAVHFEIYQGESRHVSNNIKLGAIEIDIPSKKAGEISLNVRFTYDIDGLLEVDVLVPETNRRKNLLIQGNSHQYDEKELEKRRAFLATLKVHPRDQAENRALLARAERMYEENLGETRDYIGRCIAAFQNTLESQDAHLAARGRTDLEERLACVDMGVWE
jgi:molecular chaperone HscC